MSELFWPGDSRAGALLTDEALLAAMIRVERAWLAALHEVGMAPESQPLLDIGVGEIRDGAESGGNPVIPLVAALRRRVDEPTRTWLHRGLTSQDVLDTALMLCTRDAADQVLRDVERQVTALRDLIERHRNSVQAGRTLAQHAVPTTFGLTAANWLAGVLDAGDDLARERDRLPIQLGGAAGTQAAVVALGADPAVLGAAVAGELGLAPSPPWHTNRRPATRIGDALLACVDAFGRIANDVLLRTRPEFGELAEPAPGGSSTMPHKQNPVLSILIKRAAIVAPFTAAQLHAAAAAAIDDRPDGAWHAEWAALRTLGRLTATAASQTAQVLDGLVVHPERMRATATAAAAAAAEDLLAEQRAVQGQSGNFEGYLGASDALIDQALERAAAFLKGSAP
jgi:3-carboxy-cis,cis-muconate cycloisomerase